MAKFCQTYVSQFLKDALRKSKGRVDTVAHCVCNWKGWINHRDVRFECLSSNESNSSLRAESFCVILNTAYNKLTKLLKQI